MSKQVRTIAGVAAMSTVLVAAMSAMATAAQPTPEKVPGCRSGVVAELYEDGTWKQCDGEEPTTNPPEATPTPTVPTPAPPTPTSPPPTTAPPAPTEAPEKTTIRAYVTGYSWFDNTPPGSSAISHPVLHKVAGGTGTYADPITVAVGHTITGGRDILDWPKNTRFWIPNLRRYIIVEDTCGDGGRPQNGPCHTGYPAGASTWLDVWVGGQGGSERAADRCMEAITKVVTVVVNPGPEYDHLVVAGDIYQATGCTPQHGDTL